MKRILTTAFAALALAPVASADPQYGWTISASSTDPFVNTMNPAPLTSFAAFLFIQCNVDSGFAAADFGIEVQNPGNFGGGVSFNTLNNWINQGSGLNLVLVPGGCQDGPLLGGTFTSFWLGSSGASALCFVTNSSSGNFATIDCDPLSPRFWTQTNIGLGVGGATPCSQTLCTVAVETESWGSIKSLYR